MKRKILFTAIIILWGVYGSLANSLPDLNNLMRIFEQNPANPQATIQLLKELDKQGKSGKEIVERYFNTQSETDYIKDYNWKIVRDFVNDINTPQLKYLFENQEKFILHFSKDDVLQKLDNVLVNHLEKFYRNDKESYNFYLSKIKENGYVHYDVVCDYFDIRELRIAKKEEDYFYKARKLFRYFPENRGMIKEITEGALEMVNDISRLKVIQLWAGKTVESKTDFDAIYNYVKISEKCGFTDVARKYALIANNIAKNSEDLLVKRKAGELSGLYN